jgi:hypothetical protein
MYYTSKNIIYIFHPNGQCLGKHLTLGIYEKTYAYMTPSVINYKLFTLVNILFLLYT